MYVACFSEPTMRFAAENGFHIIFAPFAAAMMFGSLGEAVARFKELASAAGYPESRAMCSYFTCLADTGAEVQAARERLLFYLKNIAPAFPSNPQTAPPHIRYFIDIVDRINRMRPEDLGERSIVTGTRSQVIDHLQRVEAAGIDEVICYFNFGLLPHAQTLHQMRRFAEEVMPAFAVEPALSA
jgi:alkanesulfonate monooxygenase SsuD/methylene tetrahydromethanopterin reductase-like flavin-dependent oxidoreductase (luciferase family)